MGWFLLPFIKGGAGGDYWYKPAAEIPPSPLFQRGVKLALMPARGEGKHIEIQEEIPSPSRGRARVGVEIGFFHTFPFPKGEKVESNPGDLPKALLPLKKGGREGFMGRPFQNAKVLHFLWK